MGNLKSCMSKTDSANLIGQKKNVSAEEKRFEALQKAIEIPENDRNRIIWFKYTNMPSVDKVILQAQETVNEIHKIRYALTKGIEKIVVRTGIWKVAGGHTAHALIAIIYAMASQTKGAASEKLLTFGSKFPYFKFGKDSATVNITKDVKILADYFLCLEKAYTKMPKLVDDWVELAKLAIDLKDKAKGELERVDKFQYPKVMSALTHNIKMLKRTKNVSATTMNLVKKTATELEHAYEIMQEEHHQLPEFGKILADEGITDPVECYQRVGKKIETDRPPTTQEEMLNFPYDAEGDSNGHAENGHDEEDDQ